VAHSEATLHIGMLFMSFLLTPAQAQESTDKRYSCIPKTGTWIPAFAGMTVVQQNHTSKQSTRLPSLPLAPRKMQLQKKHLSLALFFANFSL